MIALQIDSYFRKELIYKRNERMARRVSALLQRNPNQTYFFAFGAGKGAWDTARWRGEGGYRVGFRPWAASKGSGGWPLSRWLWDVSLSCRPIRGESITAATASWVSYGSLSKYVLIGAESICFNAIVKLKRDQGCFGLEHWFCQH